MKAWKHGRRKPGLTQLASLLGKNPATVWRWLETRKELRRVLRANRDGKQWRINFPQDGEEFDSWIIEIRKAVAPFSRTPRRAARSKSTKDILADLGFGDKQREHDIEALRHAMLLKRASRELRKPEDGDKEPAEDDALTFDEWKIEAQNIWSTARMVSACFNCPVEDVPKHWREFCKRHRARKRECPPILETASDMEIDAEHSRVLELWPNPQHWEQARKSREREWQLQTLAEAIRELIQANTTISSENLAPLLFRNRNVQDIWVLHQQHLLLRQSGVDVFCVPSCCAYGKRGISLREFRQRYINRELKEAQAAALLADSSDINRGSKDANAESCVEPEQLKEMMQPGEKSQQGIDPAYADAYRRLTTANPELEKWCKGLDAKDQKQVLECLRNPFSERKSPMKSKLQEKLASKSEEERKRLAAWLSDEE